MSGDKGRHAATTIEECAMLKCVAAFFVANDIRGLLGRRCDFREIVGDATGPLRMPRGSAAVRWGRS